MTTNAIPKRIDQHPARRLLRRGLVAPLAALLAIGACLSANASPSSTAPSSSTLLTQSTSESFALRANKRVARPNDVVTITVRADSPTDTDRTITLVHALYARINDEPDLDKTFETYPTSIVMPAGQQEAKYTLTIKSTVEQTTQLAVISIVEDEKVIVSEGFGVCAPGVGQINLMMAETVPIRVVPVPDDISAASSSTFYVLLSWTSRRDHEFLFTYPTAPGLHSDLVEHAQLPNKVTDLDQEIMMKFTLDAKQVISTKHKGSVHITVVRKGFEAEQPRGSLVVRP